MLAVCQQDFPLRPVNINGTGEFHSHPIASLKLIRSDPASLERIVVAYDVSRKLKSSACSVISADMFKRLDSIVPYFYIFAHKYTCHLHLRSEWNKYAGWSNSGGCERVWSSTRHLVSPNG